MLLNIHPAYRSTLHSIQLLAVVYLKEYGVDAVMKPAVLELQKLACDVRMLRAIEWMGGWGEILVPVCNPISGIEVECLDCYQRFHGCLVSFIGDTPASALVGGFKEGVGTTHRGCRTCMILSDQLCSKVF